jgi:mRNA interferase RelE/StbE
MTEGQPAWRIQLHRQALKDLERLPKPIVQRTWQVIESLAVTQFPDGTAAVKGHDNVYRIRIGDYRLIYHLGEETITVLVLRIGHRKDVYRDF